MQKDKILISNVGFGKANPNALSLLKENVVVIENLQCKCFEEQDFLEKIEDVSIIIAGTEKINSGVISAAKNLKMIARVGVGVDSINLDEVKSRGIKISYTPDAPAIAVPEFTLAVILNLIKGIGISDCAMHQKQWVRPMGRSFSGCSIGIIGAGKIGKRLIQLLHALDNCLEIFYYDPFVESVSTAKKVSFEKIFKVCNILSVHIPLNESTYHMISEKELSSMLDGSYIINTSRGGVVNEQALYNALQKNIAGAAIDVFEQEPYDGPLCDLKNCLLTSHIGSMTIETRALMEEQVTEDIINFINNRPLKRPFIYK